MNLPSEGMRPSARSLKALTIVIGPCAKFVPVLHRLCLNFS